MTREEAIVDIRDNIKPVVGGKSLDIAIEALEQEPKTGHWIGEKEYPICNVCGCNIISEYIVTQDYAEINKKMNYCPNCGARMESEEMTKVTTDFAIEYLFLS